jgi:hypothetical protein
MDTRYFHAALAEMGYTGKMGDLSTREVSALLLRAQELKQADTDRAARLTEHRHQDACLILRREHAQKARQSVQEEVVEAR